MQRPKLKKTGLTAVLTALTLLLVLAVAACSNSYTVNFETGDGGGVPSQTVKSGGRAELPQNDPLRTGYTFDGWYKDAAVAEKFDFGGESITKNTTVYAKWTANTYGVAYNPNGANVTGQTENSSHIYDQKKALTKNNYAQAGYEFVGWNTAADGGGTKYADQALVNNMTATANATLTLYAQWRPEKTGMQTYPVTFMVFAGNGAIVAAVGDEVKTDSPAQFEEGSTVVFTAIPDNGYEVKEWKRGGVVQSEGIEGNTLTLGNLSAPVTVMVEFKKTDSPPDTFAVSYFVIDGTWGYIYAEANEIVIESGDVFAEGTEVVFTAVPDTGYRIKEWRLNGELQNVTGSVFTVTVGSAEVTVTVEFEEE